MQTIKPNNVSLLQTASYQEVCSEVTEFKDELKNQSLKLSHSTQVRYQLPLEIFSSQIDYQFFCACKPEHFNLNYTTPLKYLYYLPHARLLSHLFAVISYDNYLITDSYFNDNLLQQSGHFMKSGLKLNIDGQMMKIPFALYKNDLPIKYIHEPCFLPYYYWQFNYHHWVLESLPLLLEYLNNPILADCKLLLPAELNRFQRESLELLGISENQILYFDHQDYHFDQLYVGNQDRFDSDRVKKIRDFLLSKINYNSQYNQKYYYISRQDAKNRRISNEEELIVYLESIGFEILNLEGSSFKEQIERFARAEIIIGPHGAGLTNILFTPQECAMIELMPDDDVNQCFWILANMGKHPYTFLTGKIDGPNRSYNINLSLLKKLISSFMP